MDSLPPVSDFAELRTPSRCTSNRWYVRPRVTGVYQIICRSNGAAYIGGSERCIGNRVSWHLSKLRAGEHSSCRFQEEWNSTDENDWDLDILYVCSPMYVRALEKMFVRFCTTCLTEQFDPKTAEARQHMREGRERYLKTPGAIEKLSDQARRQHRDRRFGY